MTLDEMRIRGAGRAAGVIGQVLLTQHTDRLAAHLAKVMIERPTPRKRKPMSLTPEVFDALRGIPKATMAAAMLRGCIDAQGIVGQKAPPRVKVKIGQALELQARGVAVRKALTKRDWRRLNQIAARKLSLRKKRQVEYAILRDRGIAIEPWPRELTGRVGAFACDMLLTALPDVCVEENTIARISKEAANEIEVETKQVPVNEPTTTPPWPWFAYDGVDGETFVQACRDVPAVREAIRRGIPHVDAVNYLQSIPWRVNEHTLHVVKRRELLKKLTPAAESLLEANIDLADRFRGQPFYVPLRVDFRGRLVTGTTLNFTGPDHIRGLFQFAEGKPITERGIYWLKIACATAFNEWKEVSRWKFADRLKWTEDNLDRICEAGRRPLEHEAWLKDAGDPIQCVALFRELANAQDVGPSYVSTVPIGFDATCSGLQHYALLARDLQMARRTNLVPSDDPQDIYDRILRPVQWQLAIREHERPTLWEYSSSKLPGEEIALWTGTLDRKIIKGLVMTYCYSSVPWGQANQVHKALRDQGIDIPAGAPKSLVELVRKAIERHIRSAPAIMKQLQALVGKSKPVRWVSPSGLPVSNSYPKPRVKRVRHYLHDKSRQCVQSVGWKPEQRFSVARSAIAPNYIHSLDSAHLALVACACEREGIPLVTVHDSYNTLPCYADRLREILLEELRAMYAGYASLVPPSGDLDLNEVTGEYAFS